MSLKATGGYPYSLMRRQRGSALIIGMFVITVMLLLATTLVKITQDADEGVNLEVWGSRAFAAANSGADAALAQLFPLAGGGADCANVGPSWNPPAVVGFHGCSVKLSCSSVTVDDVTQYSISSTATCESGNCSGGADAGSDCLRVNRSVEVAARD